jgi:hypothetical protein
VGGRHYATKAGVDIEAYLTDLLTRLPTRAVRRLGDWFPRAWQQRQPACAAGVLA